MGRNKIEIKKITCPIKRRETFRKRSKGILKKIKELAILCDIEVGVMMFSPTGKCEHFSNGLRTEQLLQKVGQNYFLQKEEGTNLQGPENFHMPMPIQQMRGGNEAGEFADYKEELKFGCSDQSHLLKPENPYSSLQQIGSGQFCRTPSANISSNFENSHLHASMQQTQMWAAPQDRGQVVMNTDPSLEFALEMALFNGVQPSSSLWHQLEGMVGSCDDSMQATTKQEVPEEYNPHYI